MNNNRSMKKSNNEVTTNATRTTPQEDTMSNNNDTSPAPDDISSEASTFSKSSRCCLFHKFTTRTKTLWSQLTLEEMSGSTGDLGTFIPLVVALARERAIYLTPALFFAGLSNIITGYSWDVPMPVQPMKSIAAVALAEQLNREQVTTAGLWMGGFMVVLGISGLIELVNTIIPYCVVSGIQMGVGLRLGIKGIQMVANLTWVDQADCILLAVLLSALCLYWLREPPAAEAERQVSMLNTGWRPFWTRWSCCCFGGRSSRQYPVGLFLFGVGVVFAIVELATTSNADGQYDLPLGFFGAPVAVLALENVTWNDFKVGLLEGAIPQLPLTTLNSVISVCCLAHALYPEKRNSNDIVVSRKEVSLSVGLMNLLLCPFGSMPNCHGAGGLAGQHRLGARHGASVVFLGCCKVLLAIFFGASVLTLLDALPDAVLGVMLAIAAQELTTTGFVLLTKESSTSKRELRINVVIAVITTMVILGTGKTHYGALSGWVAYMIYGDGTILFVSWIKQKYRAWKNRNEQDKQEEEYGVETTLAAEHSETTLNSSSV